MSVLGTHNINGVVSANGSNNKSINDVIGNKSDRLLLGAGSDSLYAIAGYMNYYHAHSPAKVYPELANSITVTASGNAWTDYGSWIEIVPADTITLGFDIHWVDLYSISANGEYVLQLGSGLAENEEVIATIGFNRNAVQSQEGAVPVQILPVAANTRIAARLSSSNAAADTVGVKLYYHEYPL